MSNQIHQEIQAVQKLDRVKAGLQVFEQALPFDHEVGEEPPVMKAERKRVQRNQKQIKHSHVVHRHTPSKHVRLIKSVLNARKKKKATAKSIQIAQETLSRERRLSNADSAVSDNDNMAGVIDRTYWRKYRQSRERFSKADYSTTSTTAHSHLITEKKIQRQIYNEQAASSINHDAAAAGNPGNQMMVSKEFNESSRITIAKWNIARRGCLDPNNIVTRCIPKIPLSCRRRPSSRCLSNYSGVGRRRRRRELESPAEDSQAQAAAAEMSSQDHQPQKKKRKQTSTENVRSSRKRKREQRSDSINSISSSSRSKSRKK